LQVYGPGYPCNWTGQGWTHTAYALLPGGDNITRHFTRR
jgi:hypothetical protein